MRRYRLTLTARLLLILSGIAACSTALALALQDRTLAADLRSVATDRLERSAHAANLLVGSHLDVLGERYLAVSGTPQLRDHAHTLKSSSSNVGAVRLGALARELEDRARAGELDDAESLVAPLLAEFERARTALDAERRREST